MRRENAKSWNDDGELQTSTLQWNKNSISELGATNGASVMERVTRCAKCGKLLEPVVAISGRTELQCISCDDPAVKMAERPPTAPESPDRAEPAAHH